MKQLRLIANRFMTNAFPSVAHRWRRWRWEARWSRKTYTPSWIVQAIPKEIQEAVFCQWFLPGCSLLDIGCGSGEIAAWLAEQGFAVVGIDYSKAAIDRAKLKCGANPGRLEFRTMDICSPASTSAQFNALLDRGCFPNIPRAHAADYVHHVAAGALPGARFLLIFPINTKFVEESNGEGRSPQQEVIRYIETAFQPMFEIVKMEKTCVDRSSGNNPTEPTHGISCWMIRRWSSENRAAKTPRRFVP